MSAPLPLPPRYTRIHAFLLLVKGDPTEAAAYLASAMLCREPKTDGGPCGVCDICRRAKKNTLPDIVTLDGKKATVDAVRALRADTVLQPVECDGKVYILTDFHSYDVRSQNALLKVLEEPPPAVTFILTANAKIGILPTVLSRVCVLYADVPSREKYLAAASALPAAKDSERARDILAAFFEVYDITDTHGGQYGDVPALYDQALRYFFDKAPDTVSSFPRDNRKEDRERMALCCRVYMLAARNILLFKLTGGRVKTAVCDEEFRKGCGRIAVKDASAGYDLFETLYTAAERSANTSALYAYLLKMA